MLRYITNQFTNQAKLNFRNNHAMSFLSIGKCQLILHIPTRSHCEKWVHHAIVQVRPNGSVTTIPFRELRGLDEFLLSARATASRLMLEGKPSRTAVVELDEEREELVEDLDPSMRNLKPKADSSTTRLPEET